MRCLFCNCSDSKVIDSRPTEDGKSIRRRRECIACGRRFTTFETIEIVPFLVIKRDGTRQMYEKSKLKNGILRACEKRPISMSQIDEMVDSIEKTLYNSLEQEISSQRIGDVVMQHLMTLDEVSYIRFAAVYRQFTDSETFMKELANILGKGKKGKK